MKKIVLISMICLLALGLSGCKQSDKHTFKGTIVEVSSTSIIVEPNENEDERKSSDKFVINLEEDDTVYEVGMKVKITYIGQINESYPAQIGTTNIEII